MKKRLLKLEQFESHKYRQKNKILVIDDVVTYNNKKFKKDEFIKLNPHLKDDDFIEIVYI